MEQLGRSSGFALDASTLAIQPVQVRVRIPVPGAVGGRRPAGLWAACVIRTMVTRERAARLQSRTARDREGRSYPRSSGGLGVVAIPAAELLHPAGRVEDTRLPGVERVARR